MEDMFFLYSNRMTLKMDTPPEENPSSKTLSLRMSRVNLDSTAKTPSLTYWQSFEGRVSG
jgi:hypothetical protein